MDWEPVSHDQLALYQKFAVEFARLEAQLLGISIDHVYGHAAFRREAQLHFPLLADFHPRGRVARSYGVYRDGKGVSARALFVLDRRGRIRFSQIYPDFFNPGVDDLLTTLEALAVEDVEETEWASDVTHAEDTEHAVPTKDVRPGGLTQTGISMKTTRKRYARQASRTSAAPGAV
jgi:alkyl hydroperoxide reductase subunit AhpC